MIKKINKKNSLIVMLILGLLMVLAIVLAWPLSSLASEKQSCLFNYGHRDSNFSDSINLTLDRINSNEDEINFANSQNKQSDSQNVIFTFGVDSEKDVYIYYNHESGEWSYSRSILRYQPLPVSSVVVVADFSNFFYDYDPIYNLIVNVTLDDGTAGEFCITGISKSDVEYFRSETSYDTDYIVGFTCNGVDIPCDGFAHEVELQETMDFRCNLQRDEPARDNNKCTFDANGGQWSDGTITKSEDQIVGEVYNYPETNPEKTDVHFDAWYVNGSQINANTEFHGAVDQTALAHWNNEITYNSNYSEWPESVKDYKEITDTAYIAGEETFSRAGYALTGWNTSPDGTGQSYDFGSEYSGATNLTLYAQWTHETDLKIDSSEQNYFVINYYEDDLLIKSDVEDYFHKSNLRWNDSFTYEYVAKKGTVSAKLTLTIDNYYKYEFLGIGDDITIINDIKCNGELLQEGSGDVELIDGNVIYSCNISWKQDTNIILGAVRDQDTDYHVPYAGIYISDSQANVVAYTQADNFGDYYTYEDGDSYKWGCAFLRDYIPLFDDLRRIENEQSIVENEFYIKKGSNINFQSNDGLIDYTFDGYAQDNVKAISFSIDDFDFASDKNSIISVDENQLNIDENYVYYDAYDGKYKITANTLDGYEFASWTINGEEVEDGYTGVVGEEGLTIQANMVPIEEPDYPVNPGGDDPQFVNGSAQTGDWTAATVAVIMMVAALSSVAILRLRKN